MILYGTDFHDRNALDIELWAIAKGGHWSQHGRECGLGLFEHYMNARKLAWPQRYRHRWTDLMYHEFIANDVTVLMGSASSQKTSHAVEFVLLNYWSRPQKTLVILSTVNMDKMDIGVWAELKNLWQSAKETWKELPGHLIEHKRAITTDNIEYSARDFRKGCICFPAGTLVDTPYGAVPIETICVGDKVLNCTGTDTVKRVMACYSSELIRIYLSCGTIIECTPWHPFFTDSGWVMACNLSEKHFIIRTDESVRLLQARVSSQKSDAAFLQQTLSSELAYQLPRKKGAAAYSGTPPDAHGQPDAQPGLVQKGSSLNSRLRRLSEGAWGKWHRADKGRVAVAANVPRSYLEFSSPYQHQSGEWISDLLQVGHCVSTPEAGDRSRRVEPQQSEAAGAGPKERPFSKGSWVDGVEVLKQGHYRFPSTGKNPGRCAVFNLEVERHPSYSVNGFLVHNCRPCYVGGKFVGLGILAGVKQEYIYFVCDELTFMQEAFSASWPHLFSNGNVKIIGSGNPKHDPEDELGKTSEPVEGWNNMPEPQKTEAWNTRFMGGRCVNLVGTDSPNFDTPEDQPEPYPKLIGRKFAKRIAHDYGPNSFQFYQLVKGVMRVQFAKDRVITRQFCRQHRALEKAVWETDQKKGIYAIDPTYGGDDRCIGMPLWFGRDAEGTDILCIGPYRVYKFDLTKDVEIEDQLVEIAAEELRIYNIPSTDLFYDAVGKGTIGAAFARKFGSAAPVAVDSGDKPTARPVRQDLYIDELDGSRRLKRCDEHYSKFVSEMWFSVRYAIEADQVRELSEDVMAEGCARIYEVVAGNKIQVEPKSDPKKKEDLKRRLGKSPDLFDCLAIGVEGARQRGFTIARLGVGIQGISPDSGYFEAEAKEWEEALNSNLLNHAHP